MMGYAVTHPGKRRPLDLGQLRRQRRIGLECGLRRLADTTTW
jgi:hypothetical protein